LAETKGRTQWHEMFLRGIAGNWLVCLGVWLGTSARELSSKIIGIYLPIWLFVAVGYEHSIANMFTVQMGMILGANLSVGKYIACVMIPVMLGNIVGGGFFVGFTYWYLYLAKKVDTDVIVVDASSPINNADQTVKKYEEAAAGHLDTIISGRF
jgi:formate/nitrite transporter